MKRERGRIRTFLNALCEESWPMSDAFSFQGLRVFEFLSMCEDWAVSGTPDGSGAKRARLDERLAGMDAVYAPLFSLVAEALLREYAPLFHSAGARKKPAGPDMSGLGARGGAHLGMAHVPVPAVFPLPEPTPLPLRNPSLTEPSAGESSWSFIGFSSLY